MNYWWSHLFILPVYVFEAVIGGGQGRKEDMEGESKEEGKEEEA